MIIIKQAGQTFESSADRLSDAAETKLLKQEAIY
jgi:hypothetical protein